MNTISVQAELIHDDTEFSIEGAKPCQGLSLADCIERNLLVSPDTGALLALDKEKNYLLNEYEIFPLIDGSPQLYPKSVLEKLEFGALPLRNGYDAINQYVLLSQIKQHSNANAPVDSIPAKRIHWRIAQACRNLEGVTLDVGCDHPSYSRLLLPEKCEYIGLDPYLGSGEFRLIALGEMIPIKSGTIDNILFNTSLDHILDYFTAFQEAYRVLCSRGKIIISSYVWLDKATLLTDNVHFHHFREFQILGCLDNVFSISEIYRYECPKKDTHRYNIVILAEKR